MGIAQSKIPRDLEKRFARKVIAKYGESKEAVSRALQEAIELWLTQNHEPESEEEKNNLAYEAVKQKLEARYRGKYVAIAGGEILCITDTLKEAWTEADKRRPTASHRIVVKIGEEPVEKKVQL